MPSKQRRKTFPRSTIRKILAGHSQKTIGKSVDAVIYIDYVLFMTTLVNNAQRKAKENDDTKIAPRDIRKATISTLKKFKA